MFWEPPRLLQLLVCEISFFSHLTLIYSVLIFFIFSSDRKECQLICKVFTLFSFFLDNFSSFFVLELCSFSLEKNVTQGILLYQIFWASFSCLQNYHHITQKGLICSKTNDIFPKRYKFWESPRTLQLLVRGICFFSYLRLLYSILLFIFPYDREDS